MLSILQSVLDKAKAQHVYISDKDRLGLDEYWEPNLLGDCEDFALWCREELSLRGIASDLVFCKTNQGVYHLVVSVKGYILDNLHKWVKDRDKLDYQWLMIGKPDGSWYKIES